MKEYWAAIPRLASKPAERFSASPMGRERTAEEILQGAADEGVWWVPVEIVIACSSSAMRTVIASRRSHGDLPHRRARVIARGGRYFATIFFDGSRPDLFLPLDCWAWEEWDA